MTRSPGATTKNPSAITAAPTAAERHRPNRRNWDMVQRHRRRMWPTGPRATRGSTSGSSCCRGATQRRGYSESAGPTGNQPSGPKGRASGVLSGRPTPAPWIDPPARIRVGQAADAAADAAADSPLIGRQGGCRPAGDR